MSSERNQLLTRQTRMAIWMALEISVAVIRLPIFLVYFIPKALRQHPEWTYRQAFMTEVLRTWFRYPSTVGLATLFLHPKANKKRFITIEPAEAALYQDEVAETYVKPTAIEGTWYPQLYEPEAEQYRLIVLHLEGDVLASTGSRREDCQFAVKMFVEEIRAMVFIPRHRYSEDPCDRFPTTLQDAVTSYKYLLDQGIPAARIILSGDSLGANLAVAVLRYISDHPDLLPNPAASLLWSPRVKFATSMHDTTTDGSGNSKTNHALGIYNYWGPNTDIPESIHTIDSSISRLDRPFLTNSPIWIQAGSEEALLDDIAKFAGIMRQVKGNMVDFFEVKYAPHNILLLGGILGFEQEAVGAVRKAREFLRVHDVLKECDMEKPCGFIDENLMWT
jgi:acetyl esterase/lipase